MYAVCTPPWRWTSKLRSTPQKPNWSFSTCRNRRKVTVNKARWTVRFPSHFKPRSRIPFFPFFSYDSYFFLLINLHINICLVLRVIADMEFVEVLTDGLARVLMVRGAGREVVTIYSWPTFPSHSAGPFSLWKSSLYLLMTQMWYFWCKLNPLRCALFPLLFLMALFSPPLFFPKKPVLPRDKLLCCAFLGGILPSVICKLNCYCTPSPILCAYDALNPNSVIKHENLPCIIDAVLSLCMLCD